MSYTFTKYSAGGGNASLPPNQLHEGSTAEEIMAAFEEYFETGKVMTWTDTTNYETCMWVAFLDDPVTLYFMKGSTKQLIAVAIGDTVSWSYIDLAGGSGGGLSIKSITFTDRPTAWEWLVSNYQKVIKAFLSVSLIPMPLVYSVVTATYNTSTNEVSAVFFTAVYPNQISENQVKYNNIYLKITSTETEAITGENNTVLSETPSIALSGATPTTLPDSYWANLSGSLTVYYIG